MVHASDTPLLVLHALRLKGFAEGGTIAAATGIPTDVVDAHLAALAGDELVVRRDGRIAGWTLTGGGREEHRRLVEAELEASGRRDAVDDAYRRFLALNKELLDLCTAWQVREGPGGEPLLNDHRDTAYDATVLDRLQRVHAHAGPVCVDLTAALSRFGRYQGRFAEAHRRVLAGEAEWLTRPLIDSYHTVWFELHEDLLVTLGRERKEGDA